MSLTQLANVCSHLQNASKGRLGLTSIPNSRFHLSLALALQHDGFVSSVVRGGPQPPRPHKLLSHPSSSTSPTSSPLSSTNSKAGTNVLDNLTETEAVTTANIASRRLWLGMKYWNSEPVLEKMSLISKPTRRIWMDVEGLKKIVLGQRSGYVKGLTRPGECLYVSTDRGILEARECVERKIGGMLLCKVR